MHLDPSEWTKTFDANLLLGGRQLAPFFKTAAIRPQLPKAARLKSTQSSP